jgi:stage III sporulation protein SpoIIIAA
LLQHHARFSPIRFVVTNLVGVRFINQVLGFSISKLNADEVKEWIIPEDYDHSESEAQHLVFTADENKVCVTIVTFIVRFINQVLGFSISMIVIRGDNPVFNLLMIHFSI